MSHAVFSAADFDPQHWGHIDEFFSTHCPSLLTFTLTLLPFEWNPSLGGREHQAAQFLSDRVREPVVLHAIEVAVEAQMPRVIRQKNFRLDLTEAQF